MENKINIATLKMVGDWLTKILIAILIFFMAQVWATGKEAVAKIQDHSVELAGFRVEMRNLRESNRDLKSKVEKLDGSLTNLYIQQKSGN